MRSDVEKAGAICARELAGLFDGAYALTQRFTAHFGEGGVVDYSPIRREWNVVHDGLVLFAPAADSFGSKELHAADRRVLSLATYKTCLPRMKVCVDLQLMALKIAMGCLDDDQAQFALGLFEVVAVQFAPMVLACRDAPRLRPKHAEATAEFLDSIRSRFKRELQPLYDQAKAMIPLVEASDGSATS
jgi:hypothetical protein